jgi:hypothetical protein
LRRTGGGHSAAVHEAHRNHHRRARPGQLWHSNAASRDRPLLIGVGFGAVGSAQWGGSHSRRILSQLRRALMTSRNPWLTAWMVFTCSCVHGIGIEACHGRDVFGPGHREVTIVAHGPIIGHTFDQLSSHVYSHKVLGECRSSSHGGTACLMATVDSRVGQAQAGCSPGEWRRRWSTPMLSCTGA